MPDFNVAIDASRVKSGGGVAHLLGILGIDRVDTFGIREVHVWSHADLLAALPDRPWIVKHHPRVTEQSLARQLLWQAVSLPGEVRRANCQILFSEDATTLCRFKPMVALNHNMLPYEERVMHIYGASKNGLHQRALLEIQKRAFRIADGVIFLTQHAARRIQLFSGPLSNVVVIPHGVGEEFKRTAHRAHWPDSNERPVRCVYISPIWEYKHQNVVVRAIRKLRDHGMNVTLTLTGGGNSRARQILDRQIAESDPRGEFVEVLDFLPHAQVPGLIADADIFIFASACETFGISLLEAMAVGVPIACSDRSSLPETLRDGGAYFDPEDDESIAATLGTLISDPVLRARLAVRAKVLAHPYSWDQCARDTWSFIAQTYRRVSGRD